MRVVIDATLIMHARGREIVGSWVSLGQQLGQPISYRYIVMGLALNGYGPMDLDAMVLAVMIDGSLWRQVSNHIIDGKADSDRAILDGRRPYVILERAPADTSQSSLSLQSSSGLVRAGKIFAPTACHESYPQ
jgi:hypothetical protein